MKTRNAMMAALFVATATAASADPDTGEFQKKYPDMACDIDHGPAPDNLKNNQWTVDYFKKISKDPDGQEQIDRIYAKLTAGSMPQGFYEGSVVLANSEMSDMIKAQLAGLGVPVNGFGGRIGMLTKKLGYKGTPEAILEWFMQKIWKGKVFKPDPEGLPNIPSRILGNKIPATELINILDVLGVKLPTDLTGDRNSSWTSRVTSWWNGNGLNEWRFPAKVFCGQSLFDVRRESIIIDYAASSTVVDSDTNPKTQIKYDAKIDVLGAADNLQIRDEVRMVRPGLYLGRAYLGRAFVLNFTLECKDDQCRKAPIDECDVGGQRRAYLKAQGNVGSCMSMDEFRRN